MMNKKGIMITLAIVATLGGTGAVIAKDAVNQGNTSYIGEAQAKTIALQKVSGVVDSIELEREHGKVYYEVEIHKSNANEEFDVHVDATTGKVLSVVADDDDDRHAVKQTQSTKGSSTSNAVTSKPSQAKQSTTSMTKEQAVKLALQTVSGQVLKVEKDRDDGILVYEVKVKTSQGIAEVEIAAANGKVVSVDYDNDHDDNDANDHDDDDQDDHHDDDRD